MGQIWQAVGSDVFMQQVNASKVMFLGTAFTSSRN
jgi:hypothetical protein